MNILYIGYWPATDPLTKSVILPRLEFLADIPAVENVIFCSIERHGKQIQRPVLPGKVVHLPFISEDRKNVYVTKFFDFVRLPVFLRETVKKYKVELIIANSPLAGIIGYAFWRLIRIPFVVECFEPHADSMNESGVWTKWDVRYIILKFFEKKQAAHARQLLTVSEHFSNLLLFNKVEPHRIFTVPNGVDLEKFAYNKDDRGRIRLKLNIPPTASVGIYVGKFGGIYYDHEAFLLFASAFKFFGDSFRLIVLTGHAKNEVISRLKSLGIPMGNVIVDFVDHNDVPAYLSAADFAFSTIKPVPIRLYCCPIKNGEYWANGLPILLEPGIGDDSDIIKNEGGGIILEKGVPLNVSFNKLKELLSLGREAVAEMIRPLAYKYRSMEIIKKVYRKILN
jgi:glycosyltransferase involved in cell wall biosynthesis